MNIYFPITIETPSAVRNEIGERISSGWVFKMKTKAEIKNFIGNDKLDGSKDRLDVNIVAVIHRTALSASITTNDRIVLDGENYNIYFVDQVTRRMDRRIMLKARR